MRIEPNAKCQRVLVLVVAVARKRGEKSDAARASSSVSSFVVRQQTKQGLWLQLRRRQQHLIAVGGLRQGSFQRQRPAMAVAEQQGRVVGHGRRDGSAVVCDRFTADDVAETENKLSRRRAVRGERDAKL